MQKIIFEWAITFIPGLILWSWEKADPLRDIRYLSEALKECKDAAINAAYIAIVVLVCPAVYTALHNLFIPPSLLSAVGWTQLYAIPLFLRIVIAIILIESSSYFIHWQMHNNQFLWRVHKWHHSIERIWWLSGLKTSLLDRFLFVLGGSLLWFSALAIPAHVVIVYAIIAEIHEIMSHLNIQWRPWMKAVEWIIVTLRYHYVHHFDEPQFYNKNLASKLTILDRIFGTYLDPDTVDHKQEQCGLGGEPVTVKMIVGI